MTAESLRQSLCTLSYPKQSLRTRFPKLIYPDLFSPNRGNQCAVLIPSSAFFRRCARSPRRPDNATYRFLEARFGGWDALGLQCSVSRLPAATAGVWLRSPMSISTVSKHLEWLLPPDFPTSPRALISSQPQRPASMELEPVPARRSCRDSPALCMRRPRNAQPMHRYRLPPY